MPLLYGTVRDINTGQPIAGATISLNRYTAYTDRSGAFSAEIPEGTYTILAQAPNYTPHRGQLSLYTDTHLIIELVPRLRLL